MRGTFADFSRSLIVATIATLTITGTLIFNSGSRVQGDIIPSVNNTYDLGSAALSWAEGYVTSTFQVGDALTVIDGNGPGMAHACFGKGQSPAGTLGCDGTVTIYASSTGYIESLKLYAGGNGADSACFSMGNAGGATLGKHCSLSGTPSYYLMGLNGLVFQGTSLVPAVGIDMVIRGNRVGILNAGALPNTELEVVGTVSSTRHFSQGSTAAAPAFTFGEDSDSGLYRIANNTPAISAGGAVSAYFEAGKVYARGTFATLADGDGYYFGDNVRGLRYLTAGDFEFQNWHLNKFYFTKYNGSTRTRFAVFDSVNTRVALSDGGDLTNFAPSTTLEVAGSGVSTTQLYVGQAANRYSLTNVQAAIINTGTTSTLQLGNTGKKGCFAMADVAGVMQYVSITAAGAFQISTSACNP